MTETIEVKVSDWGPQICKGLKELYDEKIGCNVAIYGSDGGVLDGHACILMAVSPTLKTWLAGDPIQGCHSVEIDTITCETWKQLLEFMYTGKMIIDIDVVHEIVEASEKLGMLHLTEACKKASKPAQEKNIKNELPEKQLSSLTQEKTDEFPKQNTFVENHNDESERIVVYPDESRTKFREISTYVVEQSSSLSREQPLDLTKVNRDKPKSPTENVKASEDPILTNSRFPNLPLPPNADSQMQAVMAVYYNQVLQYSMLAQNLNKGGNLITPNLPPPPSLSDMSNTLTKLQLNPSLLPTTPTSSVRQTLLPPQVDSSPHDGRQRKFPCSICGMLFFTRHVKEQHELTHTNLKPYSCNICGFRARQKAVIWRHKKNRHPEADSSVSMDALTTSLPSSPELAEDEEDGHSIESKDTVQRPVSSMCNPNVPKSPPPINAISLMPPTTLTQSLNSFPTNHMVANDPSKPYICHTCGRGFKNKYILSQHSMIHSNVRRYACDICGFRAKQMSVIYNHKRNKHWGKKSDSAEIIITPFQTNLTNGSSSVLKASFQSVISQNQKQNNAINKMNVSGSLEEIEQEVQNAQQTADGYLCRFCEQSIENRVLLQEHIMTHYKSRPYACSLCSYRAKQHADLYNHIKIKHTDFRPISTKAANHHVPLRKNPFEPIRRKHRCCTCGKSFRFKHVLEQHELIHLKIERYSCKYCGFKGRQKSLIYQHNQQKHIDQKAWVKDLFAPKFKKTVKILKNIKSPKHEKPPQRNENELQNVSKHCSSINYKLLNEPICIKPTSDEAIEMQNFVALSNKLKPRILPLQPKQEQKATVTTLTPKVMGTNLVYAVHVAGPQSSPASKMIGAVPTEISNGTNEDKPPALFPSYGTPDKPHRCKVCGRCFRLRHVMEQHELTHSNFRKYMCDICGFRAKQKAVIYRHKKVKHPNHPGAGRVALVPEVANAFQNLHQNDIPPQLIPFNKQLSPSDNPDLAHNNNKGMPVISNLLSVAGHFNKTFEDNGRSSASGLSAVSPRTGMGWYVPPDKDDSDDEMFSTGDNLSANMAMGVPSMVPSTTAINLSLPRLAPLSPEQHSPTDDTDKRYSCKVCGRLFKHRHVLEQHYITHTGLRPYKCEFCDFCARQKASLWRHKQKHLIGGQFVAQ